MAHFSPKQRDPFRNSLMPSRRHCRQAAARYRANALSSPTPDAAWADGTHCAESASRHGSRRSRGPPPGANRWRPLHLLQSQVHRLARGVLRRGLRGEGRALARALEPDAAGARPRDHVAHLVRQGDDRVVERRLDVGDAHADFLALPLAPALAGRSRGFRLFLLRRLLWSFVSHAWAPYFFGGAAAGAGAAAATGFFLTM